jgi:hypothetical protein
VNGVATKDDMTSAMNIKPALDEILELIGMNLYPETDHCLVELIRPLGTYMDNP